MEVVNGHGDGVLGDGSLFVARNRSHGCDDGNGFGGYNARTSKKMVLIKLEDYDTCEELMENGIVGGHSTFKIRILRYLGAKQ